MSTQDKCKKCGERYTNSTHKWCKSCHINNLKENFKNWTSKNENIDDIIRKMQLKINEWNDIIFEWIPYDQFNDIKRIYKSADFDTYSAIWKDGPLIYDYENKNEYVRDPDKKFIVGWFNISNAILVKV